MKLLLDEMYPSDLAEGLRAVGLDALTVDAAGLAGRSDDDVFAGTVSLARVLLTENVGDFARIAADHTNAGGRHSGVLVALSSRFSRRPHGRVAIVSALAGVASEDVTNLVVYLRPAD